MTDSNFLDASHHSFESIKQFDHDGQEYWNSRDMARVLGYSDYRNFLNIIEKAKTACVNSSQQIQNHFVDLTDMVKIGSGSERSVNSIALSRYACYLIIQNADPAKEIVALGQTYFAFQTRKQELADQETDRRVMLRLEMKLHNTKLAQAAKTAGVLKPLDYAIFQNYGYKGLYNGLSATDIHKKKGLKKSQSILDHMGSSELAANLFRATQTEEKLRRENIQGKSQANQTHYEVGLKIRQTIQELGGTMPEDLPTQASIKKLAQEKEKLLIEE